MAEESTLARPYAQAIFELAKNENNLKEWSGMLRSVADVVENDALQAAVGNPRIGKLRLAPLVIEVCGDQLTEQGQNFVKLVVENGRLPLVPEVLAVYEDLRAEAEATVQATVASAFELTADQVKAIAGALKARLKKEVTVTSQVDPSIVGGAIIKAGDLVIDGSVNAQLDKLANALSS